MICEIENCNKKSVRNKSTICEMHYYRMRRTGSYKLDHSKYPKYTRKIDIKVDENNCFIVTSHKPYAHGYYMVQMGGVRKQVHRLVYEECFGLIEPGLVVRHKCDVRNCVNPEHLEVGTQADNVNDTVKRGRTLKGEKNPTSKLTDDIVIEIKTMLKNGHRNVDIAKKFNLHKSTVCNIKRGAWSHIII